MQPCVSVRLFIFCCMGSNVMHENNLNIVISWPFHAIAYFRDAFTF